MKSHERISQKIKLDNFVNYSNDPLAGIVNEEKSVAL